MDALGSTSIRPKALPIPWASMIHIAGVYVVITSLLYALSPLMAEWPIWARTAILVPLMLGAIKHVITPLANTAALRATRRESLPELETLT